MVNISFALVAGVLVGIIGYTVSTVFSDSVWLALGVALIGFVVGAAVWGTLLSRSGGDRGRHEPWSSDDDRRRVR